MIQLNRRSRRLITSAITIILACLVLYKYQDHIYMINRNEYEILVPEVNPDFAPTLYPVVENYPSYVFAGNSPNRDLDTKGQPITRESATLLSLVRNSELDEMLKTIQNVEQRFNKNFHYDWNFLNDEEFTSEFKYKVSKACSGRVIFTRIPKKYWSVPEYIDYELMEKTFQRLRREHVIYADSISYRNMCRFNSGFFFRMNILNQYQYYWRVEPKIDFSCDIPNDPFTVMRENKKKYGFTMALSENKKTVRQLWATAQEFFDSHQEYINPEFDLSFISKDDGETYNLCHFWSNFEIADLSFYREKGYLAYFKHLDETGNFYYERWGDAPVHSIATAFFLKSEELHFFDNTGYKHKPNRSCPQSERIRRELNCDCNPAKDFTYGQWSCVPRYLKVFHLPIPEGGNI